MKSLKGARSGPDNRIKGARIAAMTKIVRWLGRDRRQFAVFAGIFGDFWGEKR